MKYVNPKLFKNFNDIIDNKDVGGDFVWLLLAADEVVNNIIMFGDSDSDYNSTILKKSVVGFATVDKKSLTMEQTDVSTIRLTIPGSKGTGNILYTIGSNTPETTGFPAKALALVKTNCIFNDTDSVDAIVQEFKTEGYYSYSSPTGGEQAFKPGYIEGVKEDDILGNEKIIVIAAYSVEGNDTAINNYNFSGFTVSNSNVEITGLCNENA